MKCKTCGEDVDVVQEYEATDRLVGQWDGNQLTVVESKSTGYCENTNDPYAICRSGHVDFDIVVM